MITSDEARHLVCNDLEPVRQFLQNAIKMKSRGEGHHFAHVVDQLRTRNDPEMLWKIYLGLVSSVSNLTQRPEDYSDLIQSLFSYNWMMETKINIAFMNLINHLISANSVYFIPTLQLVVRSLVIVSSSTGIASDEVRAILHRTLKNAVILVPTGIVEVLPVLASNFPFRRQSVEIISGYCAELLNICDYMPVLQTRILELITEKCLEIDVEIVIEDSGEVMLKSDPDEDAEKGMFEFDDPQDDIPQQTQGTANSAESSQQQIAAAVSESAEKLDALLILLVHYIDKQVVLGHEHSDRLFCNLIAVFEDKVLPAHRSKFVQFVIFYMCSNNERYSILFTRKLLNIFQDDRNSLWKRQCAVTYLASYCARAGHLPLGIVRDVLVQLIEWANRYVIICGASQMPTLSSSVNQALSMPGLDAASSGLTLWRDDDVDEFGRTKSKPTSSSGHLTMEQRGKHEVFLCCVQACCYILCFHGTEMSAVLKTDPAQQFMWEQVITSRIMPLRFCLATVRQEFLRLVQHASFLRDLVWEILPDDIKITSDAPNTSAPRVTSGGAVRIEIPGRTRISSMTIDTNRGIKANPLDSFFPFDPCLLRAIHSVVESTYRSWAGLPGIDTAAGDNPNTGDSLLVGYEDLEYQDDDAFSDMDMYSTSSGSSMTSIAFSLSSADPSAAALFHRSYISTERGDSSGLAIYSDGIAAQIDVTDEHSHGDDDYGISEMAANNWALPVRRPRQCSINSNGSW